MNANLIGVSSRHHRDRIKAVNQIALITKFTKRSFDDVILEFTSQATGIPEEELKDGEIMNSNLGKEWSYVRNETIMEEGLPKQKPMRHYLTPKIIFNRLKYDMRIIHSDFWVNVFFNTIYNRKESYVFPIQYPNQADAILERGGAVIRIETVSSQPLSKEDIIMDNYEKFSFNIDVKNDGELRTKLDVCLSELMKTSK